jgi:hypothetical protein
MAKNMDSSYLTFLHQIGNKYILVEQALIIAREAHLCARLGLGNWG